MNKARLRIILSRSTLLFSILLLALLASSLTGCATPEEAGYQIMMGKIDSTYEPVRVDPTESALVIIDEDHHEIHEGGMFTLSDTVAADTTTVQWQVTTANSTKYAHLVFSLFSTGEATFTVTEGSDRTDGTALQEINKRRVGTVDIADTVVTRTPTGGTTDGAITLLVVRTGSTGVAGKTIEGGSARAENEYILRPATKYVISITTYAAVYVTCKLDWYEVTD